MKKLYEKYIKNIIQYLIGVSLAMVMFTLGAIYENKKQESIVESMPDTLNIFHPTAFMDDSTCKVTNFEVVVLGKQNSISDFHVYNHSIGYFVYIGDVEKVNSVLFNGIDGFGDSVQVFYPTSGVLGISGEQFKFILSDYYDICQ